MRALYGLAPFRLAADDAFRAALCGDNHGSDDLSTGSGFMRFGVAAVAAGILAVGPARAQDAWDLSFTPYLWATGIDGEASLGPLRGDLDIDFGDILDVLDGALLGHFEARRSGMGIFADFIYLATEPTDQVEFDTLILETGYLHSTPKQNGLSGWEIGFRYWDFQLELKPSLFPSVEGSETWTDVFIGYRREKTVGENWRSIVRANAGAGGSDLSWAVDITYLYAFENDNALALGLKWIDVDYEQESGQPFGIDASFFGATIGYVFD
jgi:hypothetical protein